MTTQSVQVKLELGHRATFRDKPTVQGFTHDWNVFVRGPGNESSIHHFIDKVVFHLHESFPKARRVIKEYPFQVAEAGYAGFVMPIDVYFKNKEEPKKVTFFYDLFLHLEGQPPVNHIRCEKLTFNNPTEDFRRKLIKAGGVGILEHESSPGHTANKPAELSTYKPDSSHMHKLKQETDYNGASSGKLTKPIKEHTDVKPAFKETKAASKGLKASASKEPKSTSKEPKSTGKSVKEPKVSSKDLKSSSKESKSNSKVAQKPSVKRPSSSSPPPSSGSSSQDGSKKRKKSTSTKEKNSSKSSANDKKEPEKSSSGKGKGKTSKSKTSSKPKKGTTDDLFAPEIVVKKSSAKSTKKVEPPKELPLFDAELSTEEKDDDMDIPGSPSSSISFSSLPRGGGKGSLNILMHEIDENDDDFDDQDIVTPFKTDYRNEHSLPSSNNHRNYESNSSRESSIEREREKEKDKGRGKGDSKGKAKEKGSTKKSKETKETKKNTKTERKPRNSSGTKSQTKSTPQSNHTDYIKELVLLHQKLSELKSREQIQRVVDVIGDTELFHITDSSFDFDLCKLDKTTVKKIQECVAT